MRPSAKMFITALLLIGIAGLAIYSVYLATTTATLQTELETTTKELNDTKNKQEPAPTNTSKPSDPATDTRVTIPEFGVALYFKDAADVTYRISSHPNNTNKQYAELYLKEAITTDPTCQKLDISIARDTQESEATPTNINGHYYGVSGSPSQCNQDANSDIEKIRFRIINDQIGAGNYKIKAVQ